MDTMKVNPYHVSEFPNGISTNGGLAILTATAAPGTLAPDFVGQIYIDTTGENAYIAIGTGASDFVRINNA